MGVTWKVAGSKKKSKGKGKIDVRQGTLEGPAHRGNAHGHKICHFIEI